MIAVTAVQYRLVLLLGGCALLIAAWVPAYTARRPMSVPIVLVATGAVLFALPGMPDVDPRRHLAVTEHLTEFGVLVALLGAGLKLDRRIGLRRWGTTWRLLGIAMVLTIVITALIGWGVAGLAPASALLLAAALAPTDPVLAADVQVGEPSVQPPVEASEEPSQRAPGGAAPIVEDPIVEGEGDGPDGEPEDEVRFSLTSEAGLNDGLAFPFVYAAIAMVSASGPSDWLGRWALLDLFGRVAVGVAVGWIVGRVLGRVSFRPPGRLTALADAQDGFVALAATLLAYSVAELSRGYGFVAVFVGAIALRDTERGHHYHRVLHNFAGQIEQLVVTVLLILLGGAAVTGLLSALTWTGALVGVGLLLVVRPLTGWLALLGSRATRRERRAIGFFGIRGVGSIYYLAFAFRTEGFEDSDELWAIAAFTILCSIVVHGVTATPVMERLDRRRARRANRAAERRARLGLAAPHGGS